jgi:hypothetical protein
VGSLTFAYHWIPPSILGGKKKNPYADESRVARRAFRFGNALLVLSTLHDADHLGSSHQTLVNSASLGKIFQENSVRDAGFYI